MRRKVRYILEFIIIIVLVAYFTAHFTYMLREPTLEKTCLAGFYAEPEDTLDVVFLGSSALRSSINPIILWEEYGITSYDIASSVQDPKALIYLLREVQKYQKHSLYVFDVNMVQHDIWEEQNEGYTRHITDGLKYSLNRMLCINDIVRQDKINYYFDIIKYHDNINNGFDFNMWNFEKDNPWKGFYMLTDTLLSPYNYESLNEDDDIEEYGESALRELLDYCKKNELNVEFIIAESHSNSYKKCHSIRKIIEEYGYHCFIFNEYETDMDMNVSMDFYDNAHTNVLGSIKCSRLYGKYLCERYGTFNTKNDDVMKAWNNNLNLVESELKNGMMQVHEAGFGEVMVEIQFDGMVGKFHNITVSNVDLQMDLYIYEYNEDGSEDFINSIGYTSGKDIIYEFSPTKMYSIVAYIRDANEQDVWRSRKIALIGYNKEKGQFEVIE